MRFRLSDLTQTADDRMTGRTESEEMAGYQNRLQSDKSIGRSNVEWQQTAHGLKEEGVKFVDGENERLGERTTNVDGVSEGVRRSERTHAKSICAKLRRLRSACTDPDGLPGCTNASNVQSLVSDLFGPS